MRTRIRMVAGLTLVLSLGVIGTLAQGPGAGGAPPQGAGQGAAPPQGARAGGPPPPPPTQGFESNVQLPANYTPQEAAAVAVVEEWVAGTAAKNLDRAMAVLDDNIISRPDPARQMAYGRVPQCSSYPFTRMTNSFVRLDEVYAVGGPLDTVVLFKRADINGPAGGRGGFSGFTVQVAVMVRVANGKITEWLDAPINRIGGLVTSTDGALTQPPGGANVADACRPYAAPGPAPAARGQAAAPAATPRVLTYGTAKPEQFWNVEETQAAQAVRAWFSAWQAGDPLLLGAFVHQRIVFRPAGTKDLVKGRAALLRSVCGAIGGRQRLTELYPIGSDFDTLVLTESVRNDGTRIAGFFRVQNGLITEWMDVTVEAPGNAAAANPNAAACQAVNSALPG